MTNGNYQKMKKEETQSKSSSAFEKDPLSILEIFDRLEVGPIKLEAKRLIAPYRLKWNGKEEQTELIYTYEEDVFDSSGPEAVNLASMIAAQVAINYGLFCRSMVFNGIFDDIDRRFIRDMAENTAREIYVKKFLEPNPFLVGEAARLQPVKKQKYLRAAIEFRSSASGKSTTNWHMWPTDHGRHCILSSGGKDSLLSFGLINEIGREVHPIFVNESGRHWFTALNAYRYFKENIPHTARVWVNSDRLFTWMLARMPFIRKNFADVRSDEYPIRLWTVAVFLFGVLPLIRKRGIGRLIIGDEFDTTHPTASMGIRHYDGLYDQSQHFDSTLSRYSMRKGWGVSQFSVLRPLSELLIEKILIERYPYLQVHQTSCHATHQKDNRIYPCGKCEKCRRIVGMLCAIGSDPVRCGYADLQIQNCLKDLTTKGVYQEEAGVQQLIIMLLENGHISMSESQKKPLKEHPEILKLRFDPKKSPKNSIPVDLRKPLYSIFLEHARGAVQRIKHAWRDVDILSDPEIDQPYPFEIEPDRPGTVLVGDTMESSEDRCLWGELTWQKAEIRLKEVDVALLPVGSIEQHGPHLPLDTDAFDADYLAKRVANACSDPKPLVLPLIPYGVSYHHDDFQGTISIGNDTLSQLVYEIGISISRKGIQKLVIINSHGGNAPALSFAAQRINRDAHIFVCVDTGETSDVDIYQLIETPNDVHAGEVETSTSLAVRPHLVKMDMARKDIPEFSSRYLNFTSRRSVAWYAYTRKISKTGVMGDPTKASVQKGLKIWELMIAHLVALVEDLKLMTLNEIHHRRY
jgi:creatinine amidohydrolase/Fe(II)-dependent formamide hydrolase-like protein